MKTWVMIIHEFSYIPIPALDVPCVKSNPQVVLKSCPSPVAQSQPSQRLAQHAQMTTVEPEWSSEGGRRKAGGERREAEGGARRVDVAIVFEIEEVVSDKLCRNVRRGSDRSRSLVIVVVMSLLCDCRRRRARSRRLRQRSEVAAAMDGIIQ